MDHIFLSYSREDTPTMQRVRDDLRAQGLEVWTDEIMAPGDPSWQDTIEAAIDEAGCLVVILSPNAKKSRWVREEMRYAEAQDVRIFPLLARGSSKRSVPFGFLTAQWIDIRLDEDYTAGIKKLVGTVRFHLGLESVERETNPAPHTPSPEPTQTRALFPPNVSKAIMVLQNRDNKWWRRVDAINHLGELGDPRVRSVLEAYLEDDDVDVQNAAVKALEMIQMVEDGNKPAVLEADTKEEPRAAGRQFDTIPFRNSEQRPKKSAPSVQNIQTLKLMVSGPDEDLRTRFLSSVSEVDVQSRKSGGARSTSQGSMVFGQISVSDEVLVYLFGTPISQRFITVWEILTEGMLGAVILVDSTAPNLFYKVREGLNTVREEYPDLPFVVATANPGDSDAWRPDDVRRALRLDEHVVVQPCDVDNPESIKRVLLQLIYQLPQDVDGQ